VEAVPDRMETPHNRRFDARNELFLDVRNFIERFCADAGVGHRAGERLTLIIEELFANTVRHGYPGADGSAATEWPVWLTLKGSGDSIEAVYEDAAPAHDPFAKIAVPDYTGPAETWQVGGLGLVFVTRLGRDVRYERAGGHNRIRFTVAMPPSGT